MIDLAIKVAKTAGNFLLERFGKIRSVSEKKQGGRITLVTDVDIEAEKEMIKLIHRECPHHDIVGEEGTAERKKSHYRWLIDPLDGTHNYIRGIPIFGVSVALEYKDEVVLGVINLPYFNELFRAEKGNGALLNGERIFVSKRNLPETMAVYDSTLRDDKGLKISFLEKLVGRVFTIRSLGSAAIHHSLLARGSVDLIVEYEEGPWDFSAGALLVEESGGRVTDMEGCSWSPYMPRYIASNGRIHDEVLKIWARRSMGT
ncbi:MAG: inositol monophosphatase [Candidatus Aerophobetes bacterium]